MRRTSVVLPCLLGATFLTACGSDDERTPEQEWFAKYSEALCNGMAKCCKEAGEPNDVDACKQFYGVLGGMGLDSAMSNGATFNAQQGEQCLKDIPAQFQDCSNAGTEPDSCTRVIVGKTAAGGTCTTNFDCAPPPEGTARCLWSSSAGADSSSSKCQVVLPAKQGEPCGSTNDEPTVYECFEDPAFYCDLSDETCKAKTPIGESCEAGSTCTDDAYCDWTGTSKCVAKVGVGGACGGSGALCNDDLYCSTNATCVVKKAAGEDCVDYEECAGSCVDGKCETQSSGMMCFTSE